MEEKWRVVLEWLHSYYNSCVIGLQGNKSSLEQEDQGQKVYFQ